ncbi:MAG: hypothetical protein D6725_15260 [Planctomycetota bacterium]|nr:MAG: hypothetical protein D6725_15260 [Planctomycetota bacterium]
MALGNVQPAVPFTARARFAREQVVDFPAQMRQILAADEQGSMKRFHVRSSRCEQSSSGDRRPSHASVRHRQPFPNWRPAIVACRKPSICQTCSRSASIRPGAILGTWPGDAGVPARC